MSVAESFPFRSAAFGGFNREDVLNYIEQSAAQAEATAQKLRAELEALQTESKERAARLETLTEQIDLLKAENEALAAALQAEEDEHGKLQVEWESKCAELDILQSNINTKTMALQAELTALRDQHKKWQSELNAYANIKHRIAEIEFHAHQRAQDIEQDAVKKTSHLRVQANQLLLDLKKRCEAVRFDSEITFSHLSGEINRINESFAALMGQARETCQSLEALSFPALENAVSPAPIVESEQ